MNIDDIPVSHWQKFTEACFEFGFAASLNRYVLLQKLGDAMSDASEEYICAGWMVGWETTVAIAHADANLDWLDDDCVAEMLPLFRRLGHWVAYEWDEHGSYYVPYLLPRHRMPTTPSEDGE